MARSRSPIIWKNRAVRTTRFARSRSPISTYTACESVFPRSPSHLTVRAKDEEYDRPGCFPDARVRSLRASLLRRISVDSAAWSVSLALRRASFYYRDSTSLCRESKNSMSLCSRDAISPFPWFSIERQIAINVIKPHPLKCRSHYVIATKLSRKIGHTYTV